MELVIIGDIMIFKKSVLYVFIVLTVLFFTFCGNKTETIRKKEKVSGAKMQKPVTDYKPVQPLSLRYSFEKLKQGETYLLNGKIKSIIKLIPNINETDKYIEITADTEMSADLIKKEGYEDNKFDFTIRKLNIYIPGPGVTVDYKSKIGGKYLNPQIEKLNLFVNKNIPIIISEFGNIEIERDSLFNGYENIKNSINDTDIGKIEKLLAYFFIIYPQERIEIDKVFKSKYPFNGLYKVDSQTKDKNSTLIIADRGKKTVDKNTVSNSLKGWLLVDTGIGMLKQGFMKFAEKKYVSDNGIKILVEKEIILELNAEKK